MRLDLLTEARLEEARLTTRRHFLRHCGVGLGAIYLAGVGESAWSASGPKDIDLTNPLAPRPPQFAPRAKRIIYLHMAGAPSQLEMFDHKPKLRELDGQRCPDSLLKGRKFAFIRGVPTMLGPQFEMKQYGKSGAWVSELLPDVAKVVDDVCFVKSMHTGEINHAPAQLFVHTGAPRLGRPSLGSWVVYGLGSENQNLPGFIALVSGGHAPDAGKSVWGSGFLPSVYQGVQCRSDGDPILYVKNPDGVSREERRKALDVLNALNRKQLAEVGDPETLARIAQYELAFRMQISVPEVMDISKEPAYIHEMYGTEPGAESLANNCLLARRLIERGVRFVQLFDWGWDSHGASESEALNSGFLRQCRVMNKAVGALIADLKQRGLLEDTLDVWGGEFGRTPMQENRGGTINKFVGRDHHPEAFTVFLAGGGIKPGMTYGETDELGYTVVRDPVHVHDLQATILDRLGFDHTKLTYDYLGRPFRLTDVEGKVVRGILA
ncbi:MAG: DUF1501 domain-containing protein [Vicinamibacteraceae bacterium]